MSAINLEDQIGPRGNATINSENRNLVRRWLRAHGLAERHAGRLPMAELRTAYNDTSDSTLKALLHDTEPKANGHARPNGHAKPQTTTPDADTVARMLVQLVTNGGQPVDRDEVADIVREIVPSLIEQHAPTRRVQIELDGRKPRKIEGLAHAKLETVLRAAAARVNCWLAGPAGSGKTILAEQVAEALDLPFYSTGAVSSDFRLVGFMNAHGELVRTPFREAFEHGGVFLMDEADASNPNALVALNQAIDNGGFAFPDGMVKKHADFVCLVAANTYGNGATSAYVGRTKLDAATLDRFAFVAMDYDEDIERAAAGEFPEWAEKVQKARAIIRDLGVQHVVSPRATRDGAKLLAQGIAYNSILEMTIKKGLDADTWEKVRAAL